MEVIKRDGKRVPFDFTKIKNAVDKAFNAVYNTDAPDDFIDYLNTTSQTFENEMSVEEIQDFIEDSLMEFYWFDVMRAYDRYRTERTVIRNRIYDKIEATDVQNQNANVDEQSFGGRIGEADSVILKELALNDYMSKMSRDNHKNNEVYIHDLDKYVTGMHNCLTEPLDDLLANGFVVKNTDVRPAGSINTAMQLTAVIFQCQSLEQFGGVSASHLDWTMVPYVRKSFLKHFKDGLKYVEKVQTDYYDKVNAVNTSIEDDIYKSYPSAAKYALDMTERETYQASEGLYHNLNTLQSRSGCQLPFTSINYGTCTLPEGRMVTKALLEVSIAGLGSTHKTPIFPCGIFQCMKGVNRKPGDPNYDLFKLALKSTALRLYPNYANVDWSVNEGYDKNDPRTYVSTMGCRTYNGFDINGLGFLKDGRGNLSPVTIIMPTLAMEANREVEPFMELLDKKIHEAKDMLLERYKLMCRQPADSAKFMYKNHTMAGYIPEEGIESALKHGTLVIGKLGLAETLQLLLGCDHTDPKGMELAKRIEDLFRTRTAEFKQKYHLNFGNYNTPAENLCYTALKKFRDKYGIIPNVSDRDYFTNSMHVPVWHNLTPMEKIDIESQLTGYSNAGCITYIELPSSAKNNIEALETIVNYAMDKDIPYFAINLPNDQCQECGYIDEIGPTCPICGSSDIKRLRRVTGYLSTDYRNFNLGKQDEVEDRVKHSN